MVARSDPPLQFQETGCSLLPSVGTRRECGAQACMQTKSRIYIKEMNLTFKNYYIYLLFVCGFTHVTAHVEVKGQFEGVHYILSSGVRLGGKCLYSLAIFQP